ncbi:MAG: hypothetical protein V3V98_08580, partial [Thermoplasmata archaeon]
MECTKEEFEATKPESRKPSPQTVPRDPTRSIDKSVDDDLRLNIPEIDSGLYDTDVADYKRRVVAVRLKKLEAEEERLDRQHNNGGDEVQRLREQVNEMRMANLQNQFTGQLQGIQNEFRHLAESLNRPGVDPVQSLVTNLSTLRQNDVLSQSTSAEIEAIKNQGVFIRESMGMIDKRLESLDSGIKEWVKFKRDVYMEQKKAGIREDAKLLPGDEPATLGRGSQKAATPEELAKLAKASDLILEDDLPEEEMSRMFKCSRCGADHLRTSKVG